LKPDLFSISCVIVALGEMKQWQRAVTLFETYSDQRSRDLILYSSLLSALEKSKQLDVMFQVFKEAEEAHLASRIRLTSRVFTTLISACGKSGRWQEAEGIYNRMQALSVPVDKITIFTLIRVREDRVRLIDNLYQYYCNIFTSMPWQFIQFVCVYLRG